MTGHRNPIKYCAAQHDWDQILINHNHIRCPYTVSSFIVPTLTSPANVRKYLLQTCHYLRGFLLTQTIKVNTEVVFSLNSRQVN